MAHIAHTLAQSEVPIPANPLGGHTTVHLVQEHGLPDTVPAPEIVVLGPVAPPEVAVMP
ncbi:hypothetical protein FRC10_010078, partial [Ceratobasidium sp. 414]